MKALKIIGVVIVIIIALFYGIEYLRWHTFKTVSATHNGKEYARVTAPKKFLTEYVDSSASVTGRYKRGTISVSTNELYILHSRSIANFIFYWKGDKQYSTNLEGYLAEQEREGFEAERTRIGAYDAYLLPNYAVQGDRWLIFRPDYTLEINNAWDPERQEAGKQIIESLQILN